MAYRATEKTRLQKAQVRERILAAGMALLRAGGFNAISMASVAQTAQVATGTLYRHFPAKADLCAQLFRMATEIEVQVIAQCSKQPTTVTARLTDALRTFADRALRGPQIAYALIAEPVDPLVDEQRLIYRRAYCDIFARLITEGMATGELPPQVPSVSAAALVGALAETLVGPLSPESAAQQQSAWLPADHPQLIDAIETFCLRAVTGQAQPRLQETHP